MISRGLIISLVVTSVSTACLYLYFRNRLGAVEEKVGLILDIIQDHEQRQMQMEAQDNIKVSLSEPIKREENQEIPDLIQVSDSDVDSDEDSDEDKSDNGEVSGEEIVLEEKKENVQINDDLNVLSEVENIQIDNKDEKMKLQQPQDLDSLDELSDGTDDSESDEEKEEEEKEEEEKTDYTKLTVVILKELANKKGLTGYKSLKKAALINLIENN